MVSEILEAKVKVIIKSFLLANRGRKYTSKEIADFINNNRFGLGKYEVSNIAVTKWITTTPSTGMLSDINYERGRGKNVWRFWI